ncbi:MAG: divergent polysaccharide deacetylase family protein [Alphaproteobacteria bacterium]|nr:divergent polysaccharide deacetylase family protein [Alphaproteobacteria bacterium]
MDWDANDSEQDRKGVVLWGALNGGALLILVAMLAGHFVGGPGPEKALEYGLRAEISTAVEKPKPVAPKPEVEEPTAGGEAMASSESNTPEPKAEASPEAQAPDSQKHVPTPQGDLSATGWLRYARSSPTRPDAPMVAVIIRGVGISERTAKAAAALPAGFTLAVSPYARQAEDTGNRLFASGHELLIDLPMEPGDFPLSDPGSHGLMSFLAPTDAAKRLQWSLERIKPRIGVLFPPKERFSQSAVLLESAMAELKKEETAYIQSTVPGDIDMVSAAAKRAGVDGRNADIVLGAAGAGGIQENLKRLEQEALAKGSAIGVIYASPVAIRQLGDWSKTLANKGLTLVPASGILRHGK